MSNLGRALSILLESHRRETAICDDLRAYNAPSECFADAFRNEHKYVRQTQRHACHVAGVRNMRLLRAAFRRVLGNDAWVYRHYGHVPY